jgi:serine protease Do
MFCRPALRWIPLIVIGMGFWLPENPIRGDEPGGLAAAAAIQEAFIKAIESAERSVVSISRDKRQALFHQDNRVPVGRDRSPDPADPNWVPNEFGAGVVIDRAGLILTNYHLVRGGPVEGKAEQKADQTLFVRLSDRRGFEARILAADPRSDLAVLKIPVSDLPAFELENKTLPVRKGQFVIALGNPYAIARDGSASATWGIVSNISRQAMNEGDANDSERRRNETIHHLGTLIQLDARLELGTSGGALLNLQGELIGMTTSLAAIVGYEKSAGFAIPFDDSMKRIIKSLRQGKEVEYGFLGVEPGEILPGESVSIEFAPIAARIKRGAARIISVVPNLPAQRAGLYPGDVVLTVGDKRVFGVNDLVREIGLIAPGSEARLSIFRPQLGRELEVKVEVGKWPVVDEENLVATAPLRDPWRGISYDYSTGRKRFFSIAPTHEPLQGVRIVEVRPGTQTAAKDLQPGDLITAVKGTPVRSPREFADAVKKENGRAVVLTVWTPSDRNSPGRAVEIRP